MLTGDGVVDEILAYAVRNNITKIVVGKPTLPRWREWLRGSIVDELIRRSGDIDVHVVKGEPEGEAASSPREASRASWTEYAAATAVMCGCTALALLTCPWLSAVNLTMIYLAGPKNPRYSEAISLD